MSEDLHQSPGESEGRGQPDAVGNSASEPAVERVQPVPEIPEPESGVSETILPEQPRGEQFQYPPLPEYYAQMPVVDVYGAGNQPPYAQVPPVAERPMYPPMEGRPAFVPPAYGYEYIPQAKPLPLGQALRELPKQYKKILFKPGARSFAEEQGKAEWGIIWMQLLFAILVQTAATLPLYAVYNQALAGFAMSSNHPDEAAIYSSSMMLVIEIVLVLVLVPASFFIWTGLQYLVAKAFKGQGNFKQQAYNQLLFQVPLSIASSLIFLLLTPVLSSTLSSSLSAAASGYASTASPAMSGTLLLVSLLVDLISLAIGVYTIILNVFSIMAAHRMSGGKATGSVLIPYGILILIAFFFFICAVAALAATFSSTIH